MSRSQDKQNEALQRLEEELLALDPAPVSATLTRDVLAALGAPRQEESQATADVVPAAPVRTRVWTGLMPAAAAAAVALLAVWFTAGGDSSVAPEAAASAEVSVAPQILPNGLQQVAFDTQPQGFEQGPLVRRDGKFYRQVLHQYEESVILVDPHSGATYEIRVPREEIQLVPASFH